MKMSSLIYVDFEMQWQMNYVIGDDSRRMIVCKMFLVLNVINIKYGNEVWDFIKVLYKLYVMFCFF